MYFFVIRARINPRSAAAKEFKDAGGAYVSCYIQFKDGYAAERLAWLLIRRDGWIPEITTDCWTIRKKELKRKKELQYYAEAVKYGYSMVFNMWRKDAPDADRDYESEGD